MHHRKANDCELAALTFACRQFLRTAEGKPIEPDVIETQLTGCDSDEEVSQRISRLQYEGYTLTPEYQRLDWMSMPSLVLDHAHFTYASALAQAKQLAEQLNASNRSYLDRKTWWPQLRMSGELPAEEVMALTEVSKNIQSVVNKAVLLAHVVFDPEVLSPEEAVERWVEAVESSGTDDAADDQALLKKAGLTLWEPVQHLSIAELDEHMNNLSRDLYYTAVERPQTEPDELAGRVRPSAPEFSIS